MKTGRYGKPPRSGKFLIIVLVLLCAVLAPANFLSASETASPEVHQSPAPGNGAKEEWKPPSTPEGIAQRIEDIQKEIDLYLKQKEEIRTDDGVESEALRRLTVALGALQNVYSMYNTALENLARAKEEAAEASVSEGTSFIKENPPYNLSFYENVRNQFEGVDQRLKSVLSSIRLAEGSLENLGGQVTQLEGRVEELRREAQTPEGKAMTKELQLREAEADLETARVTVFLQKTNLEANNVRQTFLEAQKNLPGKARLTLVLFDNEYDVLCDGADIQSVKPLDNSTYVPRGTTALLDAIGRTVDDIGKRLSSTPESERPGKVIVAILTDGLENASTDYGYDQIAEIIRHQQQKYSWEFIFLAANQDAIASAGKLSIEAKDAYCFEATADGVAEAFCLLESDIKMRRKRRT